MKIPLSIALNLILPFLILDFKDTHKLNPNTCKKVHTVAIRTVRVHEWHQCDVSGGSRNFQRGFQIPLNFSLAV